MPDNKDRFGRLWPDVSPIDELCPECGQPDNCGDCTHQPLDDVDVIVLGGKFDNVPDQLLAEFDAGCRGMADIDMRGVLWQIIDDVLDSVRLALIGLDRQGSELPVTDSTFDNTVLTREQFDEIIGTVEDYLCNNYGDD